MLPCARKTGEEKWYILNPLIISISGITVIIGPATAGSAGPVPPPLILIIEVNYK